MVACVWVYNDEGQLLLTRRAPEKSFSGTWENSGGAVKAGENSLQAITRELYEETGIRAAREEFSLLESARDKSCHYDFYTLRRNIPIERVRLQPGETDGAQWASFEKVHEMIEQGQICKIIAKQFIKHEPMLRALMEG